MVDQADAISHKPRQMIQTQPLPTDLIDSYATQDEHQSSMLYSILPSSVQNRLPRLPSIRRSVSLYGSESRRKAKGTSSTSRPGTPSGEEFGAETDGAVVLRARADEPVADFFLGRDHGSSELTRHDVVEHSSGIGWKYGTQGYNLLSLSVSEGSRLTPSSPESSSSFTRQLYIHSVEYLLRGLPADISTEETLSLRSALPTSLAQPIHIAATSSADARSPRTRADHTPSLLHKTLAGLIIQVFLIVSVLLPYIKLLLRKMHEYERQHHVVENMLHGSVGVVDEMGKRGLGLSAAIWSAGVGDTMGWVLEEIGSGVREGVEGGMLRVSQDCPQPTQSVSSWWL